MSDEAYIDRVLLKADALKRVGFWQKEPIVRPRAWLENFRPAEQLPAAVILDNVVYYSDLMVNALLRSTHQALVDAQRKAGRFLVNAIYTRVDDETPNPTDSGNIFCRKARQHLLIPEHQFEDPATALSKALAEKRPVVFLDDFMGSSDQLYRTWIRNYLPGPPRSFREGQRLTPFAAFYIPLVSTASGLQRAASRCPGVTVMPGHILGEEYSVRNFHELPSAPAAPDLHARIAGLLSAYAGRFTLRRHMRQLDFASYGYHGFGLTVAFQHGCPDASIPLIWATGANWTPLVSPC